MLNVNIWLMSSFRHISTVYIKCFENKNGSKNNEENIVG